ncbi:collagenase-like [Pectinophora gossypiella]|uniref:collagenase-like n=1 Tax=Pectinophora gossypiella TaxID=13191 RepID=UPI00214E4F4D|nr:collagenase-like [Pectinophora gossypiella]
MKLLVLVSVLGLALGLPAPEGEPFTGYYHSTVGIQEAARIKATEEAADFDGSRIVGGSAAALGAYPHLGGLVITLTTGSTSVCGSSLLTNTRAVTAAHCWFDGQNQARQFVVVLGSVRLFTGGTRITTTSVVMHENWVPSRILNDVAIINLSWVTYSSTISNIALPSGTLLNNNFAGWTAQAAGFGVQRDGTGISTAQTLHHVSLTVITNAVCASWYPGSIQASNICIDGSQRRSTCGGDSGGPLQVNSGGPVLIGITSFGYRWGCEQGWPAAFARTTAFNTWIRARI